jgi:hypothetical protein
MEYQKKDETAEEIMQRIRASLGRNSSITQPSARESALNGHTAPISMEQIDFGKIIERIETTQNRSLVCNISPGMMRYPAIIRPLARLVGKVILFFGQLITKPQESYNVAAVQAMNALKDSIRVIAEQQAVFVKELAALNQRAAELERIEKRVAENVKPSMDDAL